MCEETVRVRLRDLGVSRRPAHAQALNSDREFCKNGHKLHSANRYITKKGKVVCRQCRNAWNKASYQRIRQYQTEQIKADPDLHAMKLFRQRLTRQGMTIQEYQNRFEQQKGLCALCGVPETESHQGGKVRLLAIDHDHATGQLRELLCRRCNCILGMFHDDIGLFQKAIEYLTKWSHHAA